MFKKFKIREAEIMAKEKAQKMQENLGISEENAQILYAIASAGSGYKRGKGDRYVYGTKVHALTDVMKVLNIDIEFNDLMTLMLAKAAHNIFKEFSDSAYVCSNVHAEETDVDYEVLRDIFIIDGDYIFKMDEDITYLSCMKCSDDEIEEIRREYPEIEEILM